MYGYQNDAKNGISNQPLQTKKPTDITGYKSIWCTKSRLKYAAAIVFVIIATILISHVTKSSNTETAAKPIVYSNDPVVPVIDAEQQDESTDEEDAQVGQDALNHQLNKWFNPTQTPHTIDLSSMEYQFYFYPQQTNRAQAIAHIKSVIPGDCDAADKDDISAAEAHNTYIGGDIQSLRQRKTFYSTKSKEIGRYDRTVKVLINDISNGVERAASVGVPLARIINSEEQDFRKPPTQKFEINRRTKRIAGIGDQLLGPGIMVEDVLSFSSSIKFTAAGHFVPDWTNQKDINTYFNNTFSVLPSPYKTITTYLSWTAFKCTLHNSAIGKLDFDVQICYTNREGALGGDGTIDKNCASKINYKIDKESPGSWDDYEELYRELANVFSFID